MKTGVIFPSYAEEAVYTAVTGGWSADYPLANVTDLNTPSKVARGDGIGSRTVSAVLPAARSVQAFAFIGHNIGGGGSTIRVTAFSGTGSDLTANASEIVFDRSGVTMRWWPAPGFGASGYRWIRPLVLDVPVTARSFRFQMAGPTTEALELEGIEIGGFWEWPGIGLGRELGVRDPGGNVQLVGGSSYAEAERSPIVVRGTVDYMQMGITSTRGLDFQALMDKKRPFVWAEDFDDPSTWSRKCLLARNEELPPMVGRLYRHDAFPIRLVEHMR